MTSTIPTNDAPTANMKRALVHDEHINSFLNGKFSEPQDRVSRKGVPNFRVPYRETRSSSDNWNDAKGKITELARIGVKTNNFKYEKRPLSQGQIRLLQIRPGEQDTDLECDLCAMSLDSVRRKFEALSYCWGVGEPTEIAYVYVMEPAGSDLDHHLLGRQDFPVQPNLLAALRHLRRRDKGIVLWVDAICIDQRKTAKATAEKNHQLSIMGDIYNSAKNVCIWLGASDDTSSAAFALVKDVTNFQVLHTRLGVIGRGKEDSNRTIAKGWFDLIRILKETQWFSRRWIIQEIASARCASVHCGVDVVHWDDLADAISVLYENHELLKRHFHKYDDDNLLAQVPALSATHLVRALTNVCRKSLRGEITERLLSLETLVCTFGQFQAKFPQDVIHSVRSLAMDAPSENDEDGFGLSMEHRKKSTRDLFVAFVKRCIKHSGSLDIICRHWAPPIIDDVGCAIQLPSWISNLSNAPFGIPGESQERQNGENFVALFSNDTRKRYNASLNSTVPLAKPRPTVTIPPSPTTGLHEDRVKTMSGPEYTASFVNTPTSERNLTSFPFASKAQKAEVEDLRPNPTSGHDIGHEGGTAIQTIQKFENSNKGSGGSLAVQNAVGDPKDAKHLQRLESPGSTSQGASNRRRSRASSTLPPVQENPSSSQQQTDKYWEVLVDALKFPGKLKKPNVRRTSMSGKEVWTQHDTEHIENESGELEVQGFLLGTITRCSDIMRDGIIPGGWLEKLGWDRDSRDNRVEDRLWRTLVADRNPEGESPPTWYQRACLHCLKDIRLTNTKGDLNSHKIRKEADPMTSMYLKRVESVIWRRRMVEASSHESHSNSSLYGLAPERTKEGDIICILNGCSVPVVMRGMSLPSEIIYELVGEAYIHGKMDGETIRYRKPNDPPRTFVLV